MTFILDHSVTLTIGLFLMAAIVMIGFAIKSGSTATPDDNPEGISDVEYLRGG